MYNNGMVLPALSCFFSCLPLTSPLLPYSCFSNKFTALAVKILHFHNPEMSLSQEPNVSNFLNTILWEERKNQALKCPFVSFCAVILWWVLAPISKAIYIWPFLCVYPILLISNKKSNPILTWHHFVSLWNYTHSHDNFAFEQYATQEMLITQFLNTHQVHRLHKSRFYFSFFERLFKS